MDAVLAGLDPDLTDAIERNRHAVAGVVRGDPSPIHALYDEADDVTLGNPFGPFVRGRAAVVATTTEASSRYADGELVGVDTVSVHRSGDLAVTVETEHVRARLGGTEAFSEVSLRCTSVFRRGPDGWRLLHRHADPITTPRTVDSLRNP